jgi:uncharacterized protein (UPF0262 family)
MNHTHALIREGSSSVTLPVRKPKWSTQSSTDSPCAGKIESITFESTTQKWMPYRIRYRLVREGLGQFFSFHLMNGNQVRRNILGANAPTDLVRRLNTHYRNAEAYFPEAFEIPAIDYHFDRANNEIRIRGLLQEPCYYVSCPPRSAIYTTDPQFFNALGFNRRQIRIERRNIVSNRANGPVTYDVEVYGFFNTSVDQYLSVSAAYSTDLTQTLMRFLNPDEVLTPIVIIQIEMMDIDNIEGGGPDEYTIEEDVALRLLNEMFEEIPENLNLKATPVVAYSYGGQVANPNAYHSRIVVDNRTVPNSRARVEIQLENDLRRAFSLSDADATLAFPLDNRTEYTLTAIHNSKIDPFKGLYPIKCESLNFGEAKSWDKNRGYVHVLALMHDKGWDKVVHSEWVNFYADCTYLTLEFYDYSNALVVFSQDIYLHLLLTFKPAPVTTTTTLDDSQVPGRPCRNACRCLQSHHHQ